MNTSEKIEHLLEVAFNPESLNITDESWKHAGHAGVQESGGGHFVVEIKSHHFNNLSRIQCHRLIYSCLQSLFPADIHALNIQIKT